MPNLTETPKEEQREERPTSLDLDLCGVGYASSGNQEVIDLMGVGIAVITKQEPLDLCGVGYAPTDAQRELEKKIGYTLAPLGCGYIICRKIGKDKKNLEEKTSTP